MSGSPSEGGTAPVVTVRGAIKRYADLAAVDCVDLTIPRGTCYALLGPNGAGKTTLSRIISAVTPADGGEIRVFGMDPWAHQPEVKARLGVVMQEEALDEDLDVASNLRVFGLFHWLRGPAFRERAAELLEEMGLAGREKTRLHELSGGMRRRLMIARALLHRPDLLILDEPTTGLDPQVRHAIWAVIRRLRAGGITVLLTTHYMEEAAQLADRVGVLNHGRLIAEDGPRELVTAHVPRYVLELDAARERSGLARMVGQTRVERHGDRAFVFHDDEGRLREWIAELGFGTALVRPSSLEDVFLDLTGRTLDE